MRYLIICLILLIGCEKESNSTSKLIQRKIMKEESFPLSESSNYYLADERGNAVSSDVTCYGNTCYQGIPEGYSLRKWKNK